MTKETITTTQMDVILEVNKKAIEIHSEVGRQNEDILEGLENQAKINEDIKELLGKILEAVNETNVAIKDNIEEKVEKVDKGLFRLIVILSTIGGGSVIAAVHQFLAR
jgi:hypothetical protein